MLRAILFDLGNVVTFFDHDRACRALAGLSASAQERMPGFAEVEAAGARIGEVRVITQDIFDLNDPRENNALYRLANRLHINTRPDVVRHALVQRIVEAYEARETADREASDRPAEGNGQNASPDAPD